MWMIFDEFGNQFNFDASLLLPRLGSDPEILIRVLNANVSIFLMIEPTITTIRLLNTTGFAEVAGFLTQTIMKEFPQRHDRRRDDVVFLRSRVATEKTPSGNAGF